MLQDDWQSDNPNLIRSAYTASIVPRIDIEQFKLEYCQIANDRYNAY